MIPKNYRPIDVDKKYNLTIFEASDYFNIGINSLRDLVHREGRKFTVKTGDNRVLIVRHKFEEFCDSHYDLTG